MENLEWIQIAVGTVAGLIIGYVLGRCGSNGSSCRRPSSGANGEGIELYAGNLSYDMNDSDLKREFEQHGPVLSARIIKNKFNDRSKGYGFVEMEGQSGADKAVKALNGKDVMGRKMVVNEARSKSRE